MKGNPGQHTYLYLCDNGVCTIEEGGRDNDKLDPNTLAPNPKYGTLKGFQTPPGPVLGDKTKHATNPSTDTEIGVTQQISCGDISTVENIVGAYNQGLRVPYAFWPNGKTTYNSNSFTFTLLSDIGLTLNLPANPWSNPLTFYPGWGYYVPGLD